jgi:AraC-like DNA-binding protein
MFINVKLKESNQTVVEIDLLDHNSEVPSLVNKKSEIINYKLLDGSYFAYYTDGFCILRCNYEVAQKCTDIIFIKGEYIHISLLASGSFRVLKKGCKEYLDIKTGTIQFAHFDEHDVEMEMSAVDEKLHYTRIFLSKMFYLELLKNENWTKNDFFYNEVKNHRHVDFGVVKTSMNYRIVELLNEIAQNAYEGSLGNYYLLSKLKELFLMTHIFRSETITLPDTMKSDELEKLEAVKVYLEKHYDQTPTIKQLSRIVLLNEFKLKNGFKELYNCTIHSYVTELRMNNARKMLLEEISVNEVSSLLGYKSVSHFIASFRKYFGVTPKQIVLPDLLNDGKAIAICFITSFFYKILETEINQFLASL